MGANDGIISIAGIVLGVASATSDMGTILLAGFAGTLAGTVSMAMGEYVSVSSQQDAQRKAAHDQSIALENNYAQEFNYVLEKYKEIGISAELAQKATKEMMNQDALGTTVRERHGFTLGNELSAKGAAVARCWLFHWCLVTDARYFVSTNWLEYVRNIYCGSYCTCFDRVCSS